MDGGGEGSDHRLLEVVVVEPVVGASGGGQRGGESVRVKRLTNRRRVSCEAGGSGKTVRHGDGGRGAWT